MSAVDISQSNTVAPVFQDTADFITNSGCERATLLFSQGALADRVQTFLDGFPGTTSYAVKANPDDRVLRALYANGVTQFDAASLGEIRSLREQVPGATINFNNPIRTLPDLVQAYRDFAVRSFVVDDTFGLNQLEALGERDIEVTVRLKLAHENAAYDFGSKFGANPDQATELLRAASSLGFESVSMTFHPGSQCSSVQMYEKYIDACAEAATQANLELSRLNVGGGFPVPYTGSSIPPLEAFFEAIDQRSTQRFGASGPALLCEPGRALVGPSCSLLTRVTHVRSDGPVFLDDGVYGSLQEQFLLDSRLPIRVWRSGRQIPRGGPGRSLFGPTCDPSDKLAAKYQLIDDIAVGDWIEFGLMGAYSTATATRFNGIEPTPYALVTNGYVPEH